MGVEGGVSCVDGEGLKYVKKLIVGVNIGTIVVIFA